MNIAFVPLYIHYLGTEAYGLIGVFVLLQGWLALLDMGLTPALGREMARFLAGTHTPQSICNLVRSVEWVYMLIAVTITLSVLLAAPWLAAHWLQAEKLSVGMVENALTIMGGVIALRWLAGLYRSAITGLQRQVWLSGCAAIFSTLRGVGVLAALEFVSPTIQIFFIYQGVLYALEAFVLATQMWHLLPRHPQSTRFHWQALHQVWRFAAGMTVITLLSILLTQVDKLLLSKLLPLAEFGYYILASTVGSALLTLVAPISTVSSPRLAELVARGDIVALAEMYHKFSQMITLIVVPTALVLALFSDDVLLLWTRDNATTAAVASLVSLLVIGNMLNSFTLMPFFLQLAYGWTRFAIVAMIISVLAVVPITYIGISAYGVIAAPIIWIIFNVGYIAIALPLMHRKLLPAEKWRWYGQDVFMPAIAVFTVVGFVRILMPAPILDKPLESVFAIAIAATAALATAIVATPLGRSQLRQYFRRLCNNDE